MFTDLQDLGELGHEMMYVVRVWWLLQELRTCAVLVCHFPPQHKTLLLVKKIDQGVVHHKTYLNRIALKDTQARE